MKRGNRFTLSGFMLIVASAILTLGFCCPDLLAGERLVVANVGPWTSEAFIGNDTGLPVIFETQPCRVAPCVGRWTIQPGGAVRVATLPAGFSTLPAPAGTALLTFNDGRAAQSYAVPLVGALLGNTPQTFGPVANDESLTTTVNVFPEAFTNVLVEVIDGAGAVLSAETFDALPPVTQYSVHTSLRVGTLRITTRQLFGVTGAPQPLYGFVAVANREGGNAQVIPFR